ncbi:hypothetical protein J2S71_000857 [Olsenella profusa DSM 13989]|uniref:hypothetical protein n=1 Tax=Olsenella profusa TaxID=138595 RepID=UPI002781CC46|nr:hypothetical protein [Olsenella profusa]MDP9859161.1 hypothetical protein [Olsenella profusa DSM 13989]
MGEGAVWSESFDYDEATFYRYFAVHMGPHEASLASDLLGQAVVYLLLTAVLYVGPIVGLAAGRSIQAVMGDMVGALGVPLLLFFVVVLVDGVACLVLGVRALRGCRPDPSSPDWRERARLSLAWVAAGRGGSPYDPAIEKVFDFRYRLLLVRGFGDDWYDDYRFLRGLPSGDGGRERPRPVPLSAAVCADGVRRGPSGELVPWSEVHDLLEDGDPGGVAVLRSERLGETLLLKGGFGAPWGEVRAYIEGAIRRSRPRRRIGGAIRRAGEVLSGKRSIGE